MAKRTLAEEEAAVKKAVAEIERLIPVAAAFFFGSRACGQGDEWSDYDVAVFTPALKGNDFRAKEKLWVKLTLAVGGDFELHLFPAARLRNAKRYEFAGYIIEKGTRIR